MKRILGAVFAVLGAAWLAYGAEVTTSGLLGTSGESGLVDGATVTSQVVTFTPTSSKGSIFIEGYNDTTNELQFEHTVPIKRLTLNGVNTILTLSKLPAIGGSPAAVSGHGVLVYANNTNLRVEFSMSGNVEGKFGGATVAGYGDGVFVWRATTQPEGSGGLVVAKVASTNMHAGANGWANTASFKHLNNGNFEGAHSGADRAFCQNLCGNPGTAATATGAPTKCGESANSYGPGCVAACNCYYAAAGEWGTCGSDQCENYITGGGTGG